MCLKRKYFLVGKGLYTSCHVTFSFSLLSGHNIHISAPENHIIFFLIIVTATEGMAGKKTKGFNGNEISSINEKVSLSINSIYNNSAAHILASCN